MKDYFITKNNFVAEVTPISGTTDNYFIMEFFLKNQQKTKTN